MTERPVESEAGAKGLTQDGQPPKDWLGWTVRVALTVYLAPVLLVVLAIGGASVVATTLVRWLRWVAGPLTSRKRHALMIALKADSASLPPRLRGRPLGVRPGSHARR